MSSGHDPTGSVPRRSLSVEKHDIVSNVFDKESSNREQLSQQTTGVGEPIVPELAFPFFRPHIKPVMKR